MSTKSATKIHQLSELPAEFLAVPNHTAASKSIKTLLDQPLILTAAVPFGKTPESQGFKVTAHLADEPDQPFVVRVYSAQPKTALAEVLKRDLLPLACKFTKANGRYVLA